MTMTMNPGRELDGRVAQEVFNRPVVRQKRLVYEQTDKGSRPLAEYSSDMNFAWEVAARMHISVLPIEGGQWFAIVGRPEDGWKSPQDFIEFLQQGNFVHAGAAIGESAAHAICLAAVQAVENRRLRSEGAAGNQPSALTREDEAGGSTTSADDDSSGRATGAATQLH